MVAWLSRRDDELSAATERAYGSAPGLGGGKPRRYTALTESAAEARARICSTVGSSGQRNDFALLERTPALGQRRAEGLDLTGQGRRGGGRGHDVAEGLDLGGGRGADGD